MRVIFVHGAFVRDGGWWWQYVARLLAGDGIASTAVALPSCGEGTAPASAIGPGLADDAAALRAVLDDGGGSAVVVAHSYGGTVAAEGARHTPARHLIYISSFLPHIGDTHASLSPPAGKPLPVQAAEGGALRVNDHDRAGIDDRLLHDVHDVKIVDQAHARLATQSPAAFSTPTTEAAWQHIESTYLLCSEDRSTDPALQQVHAERAGRLVTLPTGHHPFLARPELVAAIIRDVLGAVPTS